MDTGYTDRIEEGSKNDSQIFVIHALKAQKKFLVARLKETVQGLLMSVIKA